MLKTYLGVLTHFGFKHGRRRIRDDRRRPIRLHRSPRILVSPFSHYPVPGFRHVFNATLPLTSILHSNSTAALTQQSRQVELTDACPGSTPKAIHPVWPMAISMGSSRVERLVLKKPLRYGRKWAIMRVPLRSGSRSWTAKEKKRGQ